MEKILIVRLSAIGDIILSTAILPGIRKLWPNAQIHWLTEDFGGELLRSNEHIDGLTVMPRRRWKGLIKERKYLTFLREITAMRRQVRAIGADVVIDAQGLMRSAFWATASGAKRRIGLRSHEGSQWLMHEVVRCEENPSGRMCNDYRALLEYLGLRDLPFSMSLRPTEQSRAKAEELIPEGSARPVFLFPFTTRPQKHWFADRWAALATRIVRELGREVWILGGPADQNAAKEIAENSGVSDKIRIVAGKESNLIDKMGLVERAAVSIGVDTGLSHMSLALGTPTVVMFGSTCVYTDTSPLPGIILYEKMPCSPCHRHPSCNGQFTCMRKIEVDTVFDKLRLLMDGR